MTHESKAIFPLLDEILDNLPGLVFRTLNDGRWTFAYASRGARSLLGYAPEELVNVRQLRSMIPRADQAMNRKVLAGLTPRQPHYKVVYRLRTATGETKWVREEGTGIFAQNGALVALDAFLMDISDQKQTEEQLRRENMRLRSNIRDHHRLDNLIGKSLAMRELYERISKAAATRATVVVTGESGTGKELAARAIHNLSARSTHPFVVVNCGAVAANLMESEFFGYRKGAFSGALNDRKGLLDAAQGGTLFLDEVGEIPISLQIKLLRVLDGGGYTPVGDTGVRHSDFRLITAANRQLEELVRAGCMREDFYYRINAIRIRMPSLRERRDDILMLADYFVDKYAHGRPRPTLSGRARQMLLNYSWPGNVRELQNVIYRFLTLGTIELTGNIFTKSAPAAESDGKAGAGQAAGVAAAEKSMILEALQRCKWHIGRAAAELGFSRRTMQRRMKKYNLRR